MLEQTFWIIASCIGSLAGTFLCVFIGNFLGKILDVPATKEYYGEYK